MKYLKAVSYLLIMVAFFTSCEKETLLLPKSSEFNTQPFDIEQLNAKSSIEVYGGELYALSRYDSDYSGYSYGNVHLYNYDATNDNIEFNHNYSDGNTYLSTNFGFDYNYADGLIYLLAYSQHDYNGYRNLYIWDKETNSKTLIEQIISVTGNKKPQDLTFGNDGTLYFVFQGGEVNSYNVTTKTMSAFMNLSRSSGASGLTYDFDNDRLIYTTGAYPRYFYSVDLPSGTETFLFSQMIDNHCGDYRNSIEYVGNNKLIAFGLWGCNFNSIYTIDLTTEDNNFIGYSAGSYTKDVLFFVNPDVDGDGVLNEEDPYPNSNMSESLYFGRDYLDIDNKFVEPGVTMMDQIDNLINQINESYNGNEAKSQEGEDNWEELHKAFSTKLAHITYYWRINKLITAGERAKISSYAWGANIPYNEMR